MKHSPKKSGQAMAPLKAGTHNLSRFKREEHD